MAGLPPALLHLRLRPRLPTEKVDNCAIRLKKEKRDHTKRISCRGLARLVMDVSSVLQNNWDQLNIKRSETDNCVFDAQLTSQAFVCVFISSSPFPLPPARC
ncbi:hypothetical protein J6590_011981 [Homalodisca vitripennis]|nr:hypothetical protein J6590_011981 [Homalodisca vitripennis]